MTLSLPHVLLVAALVLTACGNGDAEDASGPTATATTTASPDTSPAPTTSPADDSVVRIAVVDVRGRVVLLDGDSGDQDRVLMDGVEVVTSGRSPAVSPDRRRLLRHPGPGVDGGRRAARLHRGRDQDGRPRHRPAATSLREARRLGPEDTDGTWSDVAALSDGRLAVIERCCEVPDPDPERWRVLAVDPRDGATGAAVLDRQAVRIDGRADGDGLLLIQDGGPGGGTLLRWDGSGQPRELADDVLVAAW